MASKKDGQEHVSRIGIDMTDKSFPDDIRKFS
jgi:hypothetical protein